MWKNSKNTFIIPDKFSISGTDYNVLVVENAEKDLGGEALGDFSELVREIRVAKKCIFEDDIINIPEEEIIKIYLHELGHCFGVWYKNDHSETFANAFPISCLNI
jgi:hypothetical protein